MKKLFLVLGFLSAFSFNSSYGALTEADKAELGVSKNYISNGGFERGLAGVKTYADAAGTLPVDGTGGSPSSISISAPTSSPLRGKASLLITKAASNGQGEGASYDFTIDDADSDFPQMQRISFDYAASANFHLGSNQVTDISDVTVYIYDIDVSQIIQPANFILDGSGHFSASFQPNFADTHYRLIFHTSTTNALAWTLKVDSVKVGPSSKSVGPIVTDFKSYTPALASWGGATSVNVKWREVGDSVEITGTFITGTVSGSSAQIDLPPGLVMDASVATNQVIGLGFGDNISVNFPFVILGSAGNTQAFIGLANVSSTSPFTLFAANGVASNGQKVSVNLKVKIAGWSSNVQMSSDAGPPVVATRAVQLSGSFNTSAFATLVYSGTVVDTTGSYNTSTGVYTAPASGNYDFDAIFNAASIVGVSGNFFYRYLKNGSVVVADGSSYPITGSTSQPVTLHAGSVPLLAGDTIEFQAWSNANTPSFSTNTATSSYFSISKIQSSASVAQDSSVNMSVWRNGAFNTGSGTNTTIIFDTVNFDSHGAYNTSTGEYVVPVPGKYAVDSGVEYDPGGNWAAGNVVQLHLNQNGTQVRDFGGYQSQMGSSGPFIVFIASSVIVDAKAGDTLDVSVFQNQANTGSVNNVQNRCYFEIHRIGN